MGKKRKNGAAMLLELRGQPDVVPQDSQDRNYDNRGPETEDASCHQSNGDDNSLMGQKRKSSRVALLQERRAQQNRRAQPNGGPQDLQEQIYDSKRKSGAGMLIKLTRKLNAEPQDFQEQNYDNRGPENEDELSPRSNGGNSLMARKHKSGATMLQKLSGQPNAVPPDFHEINDDNWEPETEDASCPQFNCDNNSVVSEKLTSSGEEMLKKLIAQLNAAPRGLQEEDDNNNREVETEDAPCTQPNGDNNSLMSQRSKRAEAAMLQNLRVQHSAAPNYSQEQNFDNGELETEDAPSLSNANNSVRGQKHKSGTAMLRRVRGQPNAVPQDLPEQNFDNREPQTEGASGSQFSGDSSLMGQKHESSRASMVQKLRGQLNAVPQGLHGAAMLQNLRAQPNAMPQDLQEQIPDNGEPGNEDEPPPRSTGGDSFMGRKHKTGAALLQKLKGQLDAVSQDLQEQGYHNREPQTAGTAMLQKLRGQLNAVPQGLQEEDYDNMELEAEDAPCPQLNGDNNSLTSQKRKSAEASMLQRLRGQPNAVLQDLQGQCYDNKEPGNEDASCPQFNGDNNSLMSQKHKSAAAGLLQKLRGQLSAGPQGLQEQNYDNREHETENGPPQSNAYIPLMGQKRKRGIAMLQKPREQPIAVSQDLQLPNSDTESEDAFPPLSDDDNFIASSNQSLAKKQKKIDPLLVKIIHIETKEISIRKMTVDEVWDLEKNLKIVVELNGNGQGNDNGSNLLVRFLGKLSKNKTLCPITIKGWPQMPKDKTYQQWKYIEDHFSFDYAAGCKWVMSNLGDKWRTHKYMLRRNYIYPHKTKEKVIDNPPPGVDSAHWATFVEHYFDVDMQRICLQNSLNREKLKVVHSGGSKSNARKSREMVEKLGRPVCRGEVVLSNIVRKDGTYANEEVKQVAEKLLMYLPQDQDRAAKLGITSTMLATPNDAVGKVFGADRNGYVRGMGCGVSPSKVFGLRGLLNHSGSSSFMSGVVEEQIGSLVKEVDTLQEKLNGYDEIKECIGELVNQMGTLQKKLNGYDEMKTQFAQTRAELRETKAQLVKNQVQMGNLYKFLEENLY
ncbi:PREDICTED: uncharacterized protein LOC109360948 isoform X3 [Lupinus angustifolius]|uniref:uncharacterized protein LOC109360948 isoform X3 n=1 Tax=Lupinus angustifolius TaxID=3871 RepID=UPI00092F28F3|nr:PREDICTED: uncharacterized protein LOC109360948 isoform X3 [Lupinus angustifolius]